MSISSTSSNQPQLLTFVNLTDPETIKSYCSPNLNDLSIMYAAGLANSVYEIPLRNIGKYSGSAYPVYPEILAYSMRLAKNETVLEIGGASGENAALFAFSDAKEVFYNEIEPREVQYFEKMKADLPKQVQSKIKIIQGSCFDILEKNSELVGKVGLIFCRNVIHFFNDDQQAQFFQAIKLLLKPQGHAIITVNSASGLSEDFIKKDPLNTNFAITECTYKDHQKRSKGYLYQDFLTIPGHLMKPFLATTTDLYTKTSGQKWVVHNENYKMLPQNLRLDIKKAFEIEKAKIKTIQEGAVTVTQTHVRLYRFNQLVDLVTKQGFEVIKQFAVQLNGHLVSDPKNLNEAPQIGLVIKYLG